MTFAIVSLDARRDYDSDSDSNYHKKQNDKDGNKDESKHKHSHEKEAQLAAIFKRMSDSKSGSVIDLDSSFGGSKCNCVCKSLDEL